MVMSQKEQLMIRMGRREKLLAEGYPYVMAMLKAKDKSGNKMFESATEKDDVIYFKWQGKEKSVYWLDCEPEEVDELVAFLDSIQRHSKDIMKKEGLSEEAAVYDAMEQLIKEQDFESAKEMSENYGLYSKAYKFVSGIVNNYEEPDVNVKKPFVTLLESTHGSSASPIKVEEFEKLSKYYALKSKIQQRESFCKSSKKEYDEKNGQITDKYDIKRIVTKLKETKKDIVSLKNLVDDLNREDSRYILSDSNYKKYFDAKAKFETAFAGKTPEEIENEKYNSRDWQDMNMLQPDIKPTEAFKELINERLETAKKYSVLEAEIMPIIDGLMPKFIENQEKENTSEKTGDNFDKLFGAKEISAEKTSKADKVRAGDSMDGLFNAQSKQGKVVSVEKSGSEK